MKKRAITLLLVLTMLLSVCGGFAFAAESDPFTLATELTEDDQFVFVVQDNGRNYAMTLADSVLVGGDVTVDGENATPAADTGIWWAREDQALESAAAEGTFVFAGSSGLMTFTSGRTFAYDSATKHICMHNLYYLTFDGKSFGEDVDESKAVEVTVYRRVMEKTAKEEKFIPDGSDLPCETRQAVRNADGSITLAFVSDIHYSTGYKQNNLQVWLENVLDHVGHIDALGSCGDMGSAYSFVAPLYWANVSAVFKCVDPIVESGKIGSAVYTFGNHEWLPSMGGDFMNNYDNPVAKRLMRVGEALRTDAYIFYCLGAGDIAAKQSQGYSDADIARIETYLASAPADIPIFVLTHFPLHYWGDRLTAGADKLIDVLNKHSNVVVLWGHNHSDFDPSYDGVLFAGDEIEIDSKGTKRALNFTYLPAGCISDTEYSGSSGGSAWVQGKGLIVTIKADGSLDYSYYTMDGTPMNEAGPYVVTFREGANYTILERQKVQPGQAATAPAVPEIPNYTFTGWDRSFDKITGHTVVTAQYEFKNGLDPKYVYLTVQVGDGIAADKNGEPVIRYAVPYSEQMTVLEMMKRVENEALGTDASEVTAGSFGVINAYWGVALPDTDKLVIPTSEAYVATQDYVQPGCSYYILVRGTDDPALNPTFLSPFNGATKVGESVQFYGEAWVYNSANMLYPRVPLNGDVFMGRSIDALTDTGIDAVNGSFALTMTEPGVFYVAVKSEGNGLAVSKVEVCFSDVSTGAWYYDYVLNMADSGVIDGFPDGSFRPGSTLTRAQAMKLLLCAHKDLADVTGDGWAEKAMAKAAELGLCDSAQDGAADISRLDFCKAAAKLFAVTGTAETFPDCEDASVLALASNGVIGGFEDGTFRPDSTLTRAQIAKIVWLLMK